MLEEEATLRTGNLNAAHGCFFNCGISKTSFDVIAKRADISRTLLYRMFKNKEDLFVAVFEDMLESRYPEAEAISAGAVSRPARSDR